MTHSPAYQTFPMKRSVALVVGVALVLGGGATVVLLSMTSSAQLPLALGCGAVCLAAALLALAVMGRMAANGDHRIVQGAMVGMMVRLFGSLAGVAILKVAGDFEIRAIAWWALGWYAAFLAAEVLIMVHFLKPTTANVSARPEQAASC